MKKSESVLMDMRSIIIEKEYSLEDQMREIASVIGNRGIIGAVNDPSLFFEMVGSMIHQIGTRIDLSRVKGSNKAKKKLTDAALSVLEVSEKLKEKIPK